MVMSGENNYLLSNGTCTVSAHMLLIVKNLLSKGAAVGDEGGFGSAPFSGRELLMMQ